MRVVWRWRRRADAMASCREVAKVLQSYLDGQTDAATAQRVARHLDACRECGLEASTYREIKAALARRAPAVNPAAIERLRAFGAGLPAAPSTEDEPGPPG